MFIVNMEGAVYKDDKWHVIKRSEKEEHAGGYCHLLEGQLKMKVMPKYFR